MANNGRANLRNAIDILAAVGMLVASGAIVWASVGRQWWQERQRSVVPAAPVSMAGLPIRSAGGARIAVLEFADYQCPFCQVFQRDVLPDLEDKYLVPGKVAFAFSQFPIENLHPLALDASSVAECAHRDGRFWPVHGQMFDVIPKAPDSVALSNAAISSGVSPEFLSACLSSGVQDEVRKRVRESKRLGISSTPTFFLGSIEVGSMLKVHKVLVGNQTAESFAEALDGLISRYAASR